VFPVQIIRVCLFFKISVCLNKGQLREFENSYNSPVALYAVQTNHSILVQFQDNVSVTSGIHT